MQLIRAFYQPGGQPPFVPQFTDTDIAAGFGATAATALGAGAYGETWKVTVGGEDLAVKVIIDPDYPEPFLKREIRGLKSVSCPNVVNLRETRTVTIKGKDHAALVFEFIDGGDLAHYLTPGQTVPPDDVRRFARGLIGGVAELHATGTVHRDIKPENIALRGGDIGQPVLLDLGLAKVLDQETLTVYPELIGTVPFMSPEQLRGEKARQLADVFGIGVVLHVMVTGQHPFYGDRAHALDHAAAIKRLTDGADELPEELPNDLKNVVSRMLNPTAYQRGSAARALNDLD
ncbi:eukaryotic-like serine/threonine-protein kinase [Marmoricola sp. URHA0025 HA25]